MITEQEVIDILKTCQDPELNLDIWTLGLIYEIKIFSVNEVNSKILKKMTFTSPMCPYGPMMVEELKTKIKTKGAEPSIEIVFDPPWEPSDEVKEILGIA